MSLQMQEREILKRLSKKNTEMLVCISSFSATTSNFTVALKASENFCRQINQDKREFYELLKKVQNEQRTKQQRQ